MAIASIDIAPSIPPQTNIRPDIDSMPFLYNKKGKDPVPEMTEAELLRTLNFQGDLVVLGTNPNARPITEPHTLMILDTCTKAKVQNPELWTTSDAPFDSCINLLNNSKYQPNEMMEWVLDSVHEISNPEVMKDRKRRINATLAECLQGLVHNGVSPQTHSDAFNIAIEPFKQLDGWKVDDIMFYYDYIVRENQSAEVLPAAQSKN